MKLLLSTLCLLFAMALASPGCPSLRLSAAVFCHCTSSETLSCERHFPPTVHELLNGLCRTTDESWLARFPECAHAVAPHVRVAYDEMMLGVDGSERTYSKWRRRPYPSHYYRTPVLGEGTTDVKRERLVRYNDINA